MKSKYAHLLKNHNRKYKSNLFRQQSNQSEQYQSFKTMAVESTTSCPKEPKSAYIPYTKLVFSKERCKSINVSKMEKQSSSKCTFPVKEQPRTSTAEIVQGSKIGIMNKIQRRPQTAVVKRPKAQFNSKGNTRHMLEDSAFKEVSGWE
jgi:hypothetical protein